MEILKQKKYLIIIIALCVITVIGIRLIIIGVTGLVSTEMQEKAKILTREIKKHLPENLDVRYEKVKANIFSRTMVLSGFEIFNNDKNDYVLKINKVTIGAKNIKENIPLEGILILEGITAKNIDVPQALLQKSNSKIEDYFKEYFKDSSLSACVKYILDDKKDILDIEKVSVEYGNKIKFNIGVSLSNISFNDVKQIIMAKKENEFMKIRPVSFKEKENLIMTKLMSIKPLKIELSFHLDFDKLELKNILSASDLNLPKVTAIINTPGFPEYFRILINYDILADKREKVMALKDLSFGFEPGLIFSIQFFIRNLNYDNMDDFMGAEISGLKVRITDKNGIKTAIKLNARISGKTEEQVKSEMEKGFDSMIQMYDLTSTLGEKVNILKDFLFTDKNTITIDIKENQIIKLSQFVQTSGPQDAKELLENYLNIE